MGSPIATQAITVIRLSPLPVDEIFPLGSRMHMKL